MRTAPLFDIDNFNKAKLIPRFEKQIIRNAYTNCWIWGARAKHGYGELELVHQGTGVSKFYRAHRVAYGIYCGPIPAGMVVCHKCDVKLCVNPQHLFLGTQLDNMRDMRNKGRSTKGKKHR